ncbi:MAG: hypothetical protein JSS86_12295 [Cyanobacteria bacterium SZAS LIN-2]|nr:hypothetical protein [Cyanobacteria bacterium SZAS LIN-2]
MYFSIQPFIVLAACLLGLFAVFLGIRGCRNKEIHKWKKIRRMTVSTCTLSVCAVSGFSTSQTIEQAKNRRCAIRELESPAPASSALWKAFEGNILVTKLEPTGPETVPQANPFTP